VILVLCGPDFPLEITGLPGFPFTVAIEKKQKIRPKNPFKRDLRNAFKGLPLWWISVFGSSGKFN
jgi:hypothetical protein